MAKELIAVSALAVLLFWADRSSWRGFRKDGWAFAVIAVIGWGVWILLILIPDLPGLTQAVDFLFKPLGRLLKPQ